MSDSDDIKQRLMAIQSLVKHPGWHLLKAHFEKLSKASYYEAVNSNDPIKIAKALTAHEKVNSVLSYPDELITGYVNWLDIANKE